MSGKFGGFSQDDINKIKTNTKNKENIKSVNRPAVKKLMPQQKTNPTVAEPKQTESTQSPTLGALSSNEQDTSSSILTSSGDNFLQDAIHFKPLPHKIYGATVDVESLKGMNSDSDLTGDSSVQETTTPFKGISLRDYEAQRRMVEEQNKHKKDILYKAIEQHSERTAAEAKKLKEIKLELSKLESELASDVGILRKQIDGASLLYMNAQKHYQHIECAFLKAKHDLQQAREKKDLLAEHLNIIISNNEDRKAQKLSDLMAKVGLSSNGDIIT